MVLLVMRNRNMIRVPCRVLAPCQYDGFLPPFKCGACGEECDPVEITCVCSSRLCSDACAEEHIRYDREGALVSAAPVIINNWRELEDPLGAEDA
jgi:hypothetical protein